MHGSAFLAGIILASLLVLPTARASSSRDTVKVLYQFGNGGKMPYAGVVFAKGAIYGTTTFGGLAKCDTGCGTVYRIVPSKGGTWQQQTLYSFQDGPDGGNPFAPVTVDKAGDVYGYAGAGTLGSVFKLTPPAQPGGAYTYTLIYTFPGGKGGNLNYVQAPLLLSAGHLYGIASGGNTACINSGCGLLFRLDPPKHGGTAWAETTLYEFTGTGNDGAPNDVAGLDSEGGLYVSLSYGTGSVVRLSRPQDGHGAWSEQVLANFKDQQGRADGVGNLVLAPSGTVYGTDSHKVFALNPPASGTTWTRAELATVGVRGYPPSSLAVGPNGTLLGVIYGDPDFFYGDAFRLSPPVSGAGDWSVTELWNFDAGPDQNPNNIVQGQGSTLVGVLSGGGNTNGTVFALKPKG